MQSARLSRRTLMAGVLALGLAERSAAATPRGSLRRLIANENAYGPSPAARAAARRGVAEGWKYAFREVAALKRAIAVREDVDQAQVMVTAGSVEALRVAVIGLTGGQGSVVAARPAFALLPDYARELGCEVREVPLDETLSHDLDRMAAAVTDDTRLVYLCNPNNPTGTRLPPARMTAFVREVSTRAPVLVDEAYLDLDPDWRNLTAVRRLQAGDAVIVTRTFSKLHGMAGLRVGYALAPAPLVARLEKLRISQMNYPGVLAATASLADAEFRDFSRERIRAAMRLTTGAFEELQLRYVPSHGNFVCFDTGGSPEAFAAGMRERGILTGMPVRDHPGWARVSMGRIEDMEVFAQAARHYFGAAA
jgi:histidinol-phosphate aminotransferase